MNILWFIFIVLVIFWFFGYFALYLGNFVHVVLIIAVVIFIYNVGKKSKGGE